MRKKNLRIGIILANCKGNLGDFAILHGIINYFQSNYDVVKIDIYPQPVIDFSQFYYKKFEEKVNAPITIKKTTDTPIHKLPNWIKPIERLGRRTNLWRYFLETATNRYSNRVVNRLSNFEKYDIIVVSGGGLWGTDTITKFGLLRGLSAIGKNVVCFPFTATWPMWISNTTKDLQQGFSTLDHIPYVREELTKKRFSDIGIQVREMPDIAFSLAPIVRNIDVNEKLIENKILLCVTNRTKVPKRFKDKLKGSSFDHKNTDQVIIETLQNLEKSYHPKLISSYPIEDKKWTQRVFNSDGGTEMLTPSSWQEFCAEVKSSNCLITNRLHGAILGLMSEVPVILVTDSDKTQGFILSHPEIPSIEQLSDLDTAFLDKVLNVKGDLLKKQRNIVEKSYQELMNLEFQCLKK